MKLSLIFFFLLIPSITALQFSPTSLEFNLEKNEFACKDVEFQTEYFITAQDLWAQSISTPWQLSQFQTSSEEHGIQISYPPNINPAQNKAEVCLWGTKPGDYKGALIFRQEKVGNSIIQFAIWLKVHIEGEEPEEPAEQTIKPITKKSKSSSSNSGDTSGIVWTSTPKETQEEPQKPEFNFPTDEIELNKPASKKDAPPLIPLIITPIALLVLLLLTLTRRH
ncbi:MAG: hypothetical protein ABH864_06795 [archaeon]